MLNFQPVFELAPLLAALEGDRSLEAVDDSSGEGGVRSGSSPAGSGFSTPRGEAAELLLAPLAVHCHTLPAARKWALRVLSQELNGDILCVVRARRPRPQTHQTHQAHQAQAQSLSPSNSPNGPDGSGQQEAEDEEPTGGLVFVLWNTLTSSHSLLFYLAKPHVEVMTGTINATRTLLVYATRSAAPAPDIDPRSCLIESFVVPLRVGQPEVIAISDEQSRACRNTWQYMRFVAQDSTLHAHRLVVVRLGQTPNEDGSSDFFPNLTLMTLQTFEAQDGSVLLHEKYGFAVNARITEEVLWVQWEAARQTLFALVSKTSTALRPAAAGGNNALVPSSSILMTPNSSTIMREPATPSGGVFSSMQAETADGNEDTVSMAGGASLASGYGEPQRKNSTRSQQGQQTPAPRGDAGLVQLMAFKCTDGHFLPLLRAPVDLEPEVLDCLRPDAPMLDRPFMDCSLFASLNMRVVSLGEGALCLCVQHPGGTFVSSASSDDSSSPGREEEGVAAGGEFSAGDSDTAKEHLGMRQATAAHNDSLGEDATENSSIIADSSLLGGSLNATPTAGTGPVASTPTKPLPSVTVMSTLDTSMTTTMNAGEAHIDYSTESRTMMQLTLPDASRRPAAAQTRPKADRGQSVSAERMGLIMRYSVHCLHWSCRLTLETVAPRIFHGQPPQLLFAAMNQQLAVILPGVSLDLLSCGQEHEPTVPLRLCGGDVAPLPPDEMEIDQPAPLFTAVLARPRRRDTNRAELVTTIFSQRTGRAFQVSLSDTAVRQLFTEKYSSQERVKALHLVLVHLQNESLARDIITDLRRHKPQLLDRPLLLELLTGLTYLSVRRDRRELDFLQHIPVTSVQPWHQEPNNGSDLGFASYSKPAALSRYCPEDLLTVRDFPVEITRLNFAELFKNKADMERRAQRDRYVATASNIASKPNNAGGVAPGLSSLNTGTTSNESLLNTSTESGVLGFLRNLTMRSTTASPQKSPSILRRGSTASRISAPPTPLQTTVMPSPIRSTSLNAGGTAKHINAMLEYLGPLLGQPLSETHRQLCEEYNESIVHRSKEVVNWFWTDDAVATRASSVEDIQQTFELLESLYWVLQELGFPFPARFREKLLSTGYACLPRSVFVSYVEAGILVLNKEFVASCMADLSESAEDQHFRMYLLLQLSGTQPIPDNIVELMHDTDVQRAVAHAQARNLFRSDNLLMSSLDPTTSQMNASEADGVSKAIFPPLASLMQFLVQQRKERRLMVDEATLNRIKTYALLDWVGVDLPLKNLL